MDLEAFIHQTIFEVKENYTCLFELFWESFSFDGFVTTDEEGYEIDAVIKAIAIKNIISEFAYQMYDSGNDVSYEEFVNLLSDIGFDEEAIVDYCYEDENMDVDDENNDITFQKALEYMSRVVSEKMLENFSADELFNFFFTATYDFEQNFVYRFEDVDEFLAFIEANDEKLDTYKEEYRSVLMWIEDGMIF